MLVVWLFIKGVVGSVVKFFAEHPTLLAMLIVALFAWWFGFKWGQVSGNKKYEALLETVKAESQARADKISRVEEDSRKAAQEAKEEIERRGRAIQDVQADYENRLKALKSGTKIQIVKVPVPGAPPAEVIVENGTTVACRNLPSVFADTINDMVDAANGKMRKP